jgi:hypothetical protein
MTRPFTHAVVLIAVVLAFGCAASGVEKPATQPSTRPATAGPKHVDCPEVQPLPDRAGWQPARGVGGVTIRAQQVPGAILIFAEGDHPTAGYETKIVLNPQRIYPPQFTVVAKAPDGMAAQVITPFNVCVKWPHDHRQPIKTLVILDAAGRHEVEVEMVLD